MDKLKSEIHICELNNAISAYQKAEKINDVDMQYIIMQISEMYGRKILLGTMKIKNNKVR